MKKLRRAVGSILFIIIALCILNVIGRYISIFAVNSQLFWRTTDFYMEKDDSLDAVLVGPSSVYSYWNANCAWEEYGITAYPYSTAQQPLAATRFVIEECRKSQPDSVYLINVNFFLMGGMSPAQIHFLSDVMPPSQNRTEMIEYLSYIGGYEGLDKLEYYSPIFAMHSRWKLVHLPGRYTSGQGCKGASVDRQFIRDAVDVTDDMCFSQQRGEIPAETELELDMLIKYLDSENVNAAFFLSPAGLTEDSLIKLNAVCDYAEERGYPVYNGIEYYEEIGLQPMTDYMDFSHANINGAEKFTLWLSQKLIDDYGFSDKRGDAAFSSWDEAAKTYAKAVRIVETLS